MDKVENGRFVSVHYKGTLENGEVFDTSEGRHPMEVEMGAGQIISGFEKALMGMELKEKKVFTLDPEDAYGQKDESLTHSFPRADVPAEINPEVGQTVALSSPEGQQIPAGKKSLAYHLTFQSPSKTLTDKDVSKQRSRIINQLEKRLGARLRD